jgi:MFS family permease
MLKKYFEPGALFSYRSYRNLLLSTILTIVATSAFPIALAVTILDAGGSATALGLIMGARVLSGVLLAPAGGVWADRLSRRSVLFVSDAVRAVVGSIVIFFDPATISLWVLLAVVVIMGASDAFGRPAVAAIIPSILPDHLLPSGNVIRGISMKGGEIAGPGIAGAIIVAFGLHATYLTTCFFFLIGALLILRVRENPREVNISPRTSFVTEVREGLRVVWYYKWITAMIIMATFQLMMVVGVEMVLLPVITKRDFGTAAVYATAAALFSLGGVISAIISIKSKTKRPGTVSVVVWGLFIFAPLVLAFPSSRELIFLAYFVAGFSVGPWEAFWNTQVQREVPAEYQARVFSIDFMGTVGLLPLGMALAGPMANLFGERPLLIGVAIFHLLICAVVLLVPGVREMKSTKPPYSAGNSSIGEHPQA